MSKTNPLQYVEELYIKHYPYLRNFLIGMTKSDEIADDIIQEVFSKILTNPMRLQKVTYIKSWLVTATRNTLLDYYKKKQPKLLNDEHIIESLLIDHYTPETSLVISQQLESILSSLSMTDQAIILAKEYYGYTYKEMSELFNMHVSTLKSRVFRMKKRIIRGR